MSDSNDVLEALARIDDQRAGSFVVVTIDPERNLFAQFLADADSGLVAELVGNDFLDSEDRLTFSQQALLRQRGWSGDGDSNWTQEWTDSSTDDARQRIVLESLGALAEIYGAAGEVHVEVTLEGTTSEADPERQAAVARIAAIAVAAIVLLIGVVMMLIVAA